MRLLNTPACIPMSQWLFDNVDRRKRLLLSGDCDFRDIPPSRKRKSNASKKSRHNGDIPTPQKTKSNGSRVARRSKAKITCGQADRPENAELNSKNPSTLISVATLALSPCSPARPALPPVPCRSCLVGSPRARDVPLCVPPVGHLDRGPAGHDMRIQPIEHPLADHFLVFRCG